MRLFLALLFLTIQASAHAQPGHVAELIAIERELNNMCRGWSGDSEHTDQVCAVRDKTSALIRKMGFCYGKKGQAGYQMNWHKCEANSNR